MIIAVRTRILLNECCLCPFYNLENATKDFTIYDCCNWYVYRNVFLNNSEKESIFFINIAQSIYQIYHNIRDCKDIIIIWVLLKTSFHRRPQWKPRVSMEELEALRWHSGSPMKSFWGLQWNSKGLMDSSILPGLIL